MTDKIPAIYAGCLATYNEGRIYGAWIDCNQDSESIWAEIQEMLKSSPATNAEEWLIFDTENWQGIKIEECKSVEQIAELAQLLLEHSAAFAAYCSYYGSDAKAEDFQKKYIGQFKDEPDFVYQQWEKDGTLAQIEVLGIHDSWIDWEAIAHDWFINSYLSINVSFECCYVFTRQPSSAHL